MPTLQDISDWRSSKWFIVGTIIVALFSETFLYAFIVPILGHMSENRLHIDPSHTQSLTTTVLAFHGMIAVISGPVIGHFADKFESRKNQLLISIIVCIIGTLVVASAYSVTILLIGRALQGVAESMVWIVGLAAVTEIVDANQIGTVMGFLTSLINTGMLVGPLASGFLVENTSWWIMWSIPLSVLALDLLARVIMCDPPPKEDHKPENEEEAANLLSGLEHEEPLSTESNFWKVMMCDKRVLTLLLVGITSMAVSSSFHATIPLHVEEAFGWGPSETGLIFGCLVFPILFISPIAGWVRDRVGVRIPATVSLVMQAVMLVLAGVSGKIRFPGDTHNHVGPALYIISLLGGSAFRPFTSTIGPAELSTIVREYQSRTPGIFGPQGGLSRVFSMVDVSASLGMTLGPMFGGILKETIGYTYMTLVFGIINLALAVPVFIYLRPSDMDDNIPQEIELKGPGNTTESKDV
ncbi:Major facilitator superfamily domain general substrate transporter [Penicillium paradoxum]|uniref:Major facilitator superfamily domain general substrate transporter n=1 Tax=Penicillium paradoxum TaxID=176176 RepID=UPI0025486B53|nr:Major facilitator superfamily domain general substrate transporter [Penicillium paradoxum]KAJ5781216.1 Major facilitator superfamily domain general substrate transporter [Penicillium paradoxum]